MSSKRYTEEFKIEAVRQVTDLLALRRSALPGHRSDWVYPNARTKKGNCR